LDRFPVAMSQRLIGAIAPKECLVW
jgi:hypothetical protein